MIDRGRVFGPMLVSGTCLLLLSAGCGDRSAVEPSGAEVGVSEDSVPEDSVSDVGGPDIQRVTLFLPGMNQRLKIL